MNRVTIRSLRVYDGGVLEMRTTKVTDLTRRGSIVQEEVQKRIFPKGIGGINLMVCLFIYLF